MGTSAYPAALDAFPTGHSDALEELIHASTVNGIADGLNKVELELGIAPSDIYVDVKTRLDILERPVMRVVTSSYTLILADASRVVETNVAGANSVTVPPHSSVAFPLNTIIEVWQYGAGQTTIVQGAGVVIRSAGGRMKLTSQYSSCSLRQRAFDEWAMVGDLSP